MLAAFSCDPIITPVPTTMRSGVLLAGVLALAGAADVMVSSLKLQNVTPMTYGANTPSSNGRNFTAPGMVAQSGFTHIRWPGGSSANQVFWNNDFSACPYFAQYESANDASKWQWTQAAAFAAQHGLEVFWQVNAAVGFVCGPEVAAKLAVDWVRNATAQGIAMNYIEVGNENYGTWEVPYADRPQNVSAEAYAKVCSAVIRVLKEVKPSVSVGCVADFPIPGSTSTPFLDWNEKLLEVAGADMDFLIIHEYYTREKTGDIVPWNLVNYGCASNLSASPNCGPHAVARAVMADVAAYAPARRSQLPVMMTEYNMEQPHNYPTWAVVEGIFTAKMLGDSLTAGLMGSTFFAMANPWRDPGYRIYNCNGSSAYAPAYIFAIYTNVAPVGSWLLASTVLPSMNVSAFAFARAAGGEYGVVLVNTAAEAQTVSLAGPWGTDKLSATRFTFGASSDSVETFFAAKYAYNGVDGTTAPGPIPFGSIKPATTMFAGSVVLPAASVVGLIISKA